MQKIDNFAQLTDAIGAGSSDPSNPGPVVVSLSLWNGKQINGAYYRGTKGPDITVREDVIWDSEILDPFVRKLFAEGTPFITEMGSHDMVCTLEWKISNGS
ncbi:hypothetical protein HN784_00770 [bacterium]|jgi:hypothetical protein|nr:hypothetical protein [bacterium]MBT4251608.1 hypothetical protein [bacterium]MBT4597657.1 hypothetical protein [bacterium]MBT6753670.1 hypothetical protein [bacterium]MBT7037807.1 hypothetical protein [bacterium]